ncbi:hypothetical protein HUU40_00490 [candidate division KSB1 bacterium]|nr:hypothetical protein [candidate division KSB1 bacterium]
MDRINVEHEVISTLRHCVLNGSDRKIPPTESLGQHGIGLDSLALLEFIIALEKKFGIRFSNGFWTQRGELNLQNVVNEIMAAAAPVSPVRQKLNAPSGKTELIDNSTIAQTTGERGFLQRLARLARRLLFVLSRYIYERERFVILFRQIFESPSPLYSSSLDLTFRVVKHVDDLARLDGFWAPLKSRKKMAIFKKRFLKGCICLTAAKNDKIIGIDWLSETGDHEPLTGLTIRARQGACYAFDLDEHRHYKGKGVGLALLAYSLAETQKRGFHSQVAIVSSRNLKMLSAATALFGFKKCGHIITTRIFRKPKSTWRAGGKSGRGALLLP